MAGVFTAKKRWGTINSSIKQKEREGEKLKREKEES